MYSILADGELLWRSDFEGHEMFDPQFDIELNKAGSLRFDMPSYHPFYNKLKKLKTTIDLYDGGELIWRGRVLQEDVGFDNIKSVYCEGALSFFNDSIVRPYEQKTSVESYFTFLIAQHNSQVEKDRQFKLGQCTVTDPNNYIVRSNTNYPTTWDEMEDKLIGLLGGYLKVTFEDGDLVLNYLEKSGETSDQTIVFGDNLVDITQYIDASEVYTVIVPIGASYEEEVTVSG